MKEKKCFEIKLVIFVVKSNNENADDLITFYVKGFNKHDAMFRLLKRNLYDTIVFEHNLNVIRNNLPNSEFWDAIINYEIVDYLSIKECK